jgi:hypothetical protein
MLLKHAVRSFETLNPKTSPNLLTYTDAASCFETSVSDHPVTQRHMLEKTDSPKTYDTAKL